jgi:ATP-dependent helicase/nuclease subunit B
MAGRPMRVFSIAASENFLERLAEAVLAGFPRQQGEAADPLDLARTTILVPTRRAARSLEAILFAKSGAGLLLPRIRPIGDIDEDLLDGIDGAGPGLGEAVSPMGREFMLVALVREWAAANPQTRLAGEIAAAPPQAINLARSLAELIDSLETADEHLERLPELYGLDTARHREAILEFLDIVRVRLPARLSAEGLMGPMARRSALLREEARRLAANPPAVRVIAAGSTGSIPATRDLLAAIAALPGGAVVLPGLDRDLDEESWQGINAQHPQHALKQLLDHLAIPRQAVELLPGTGRTARDRLLSEAMRPPETAADWTAALEGDASWVGLGIAGVALTEARDVREEAQIAALIMREALNQPGRRASLVTPDRDLARRVKQELAAFGLDVDDSAGEPLIRFGGAALLALLIDGALAGFPPGSLMALFRHPLCRFGLAAADARRAVDAIELALFRGNTVPPAATALATAIDRRRAALEADPHRHRAQRALGPEDWQLALTFARAADTAFGDLAGAREGLAAHMAALERVAQAMAGEALWTEAPGTALRALIDMLNREAQRLPRCSFAEAASLIRLHLAQVPLRNPKDRHARLSILGLLEARMTRPDIMILGGLNEGRWPAAADPGPWLNRPMRAVIGLEQPERAIGQTAHDFVQALGAPRVHLLWARRVGDAPAVPSRWVLRLRALLAAAGIGAEDSGFRDLARRLLEAPHLRPCAKPAPRPPVPARPRRLSVSRIEVLIRDPYAIYGRYVLDLEELKEIAPAPGASDRGSLFHLAIATFLEAFPERLPDDALERLLETGRRQFSALGGDVVAASFWWPQFTRIARWFVDEEKKTRDLIARVHAECEGRISFPVGTSTFTLSGRADRIDVDRDGKARIVDYKTGQVPSGPMVRTGLAPQLTLEAAMLERGGFAAIGARPTTEISYVRLSGGDPAGEVRIPKLEEPVMAAAARHLAGLTSLLLSYTDPAQPYLPRTIPLREEEPRDYDHLSRYREWSLTGETP